MLTTVVFSICSITWHVATDTSQFKCETEIKEDCSINVNCDTGLADYEPTTKTFKQDIYKFNFKCDQATKTYLIRNEVAAVVRCQK